LLVPDKLSIENLKREGVSETQIKFVGNIMIDTLEANREKATKLDMNEILQENALSRSLLVSLSHNSSYALMTLHRPSNVDDKTILEAITHFITEEVAKEIPLIWAVHPRTKKQLKTFGLWDQLIATENIYLVHPLDYHSMLKLNMHASMMLTDSGGLQEECTVLGTPCLTMRWNTERPITLREHGGASVLVGNNINQMRKEFFDTLKQERKPKRPELWDGKTAERCLQAILNYTHK
jgi:UDP-N-acetylglucosamine 2-epimerase (non-hydrolysing)